ncbi:hypothetical protein PENARI_c043G11853 [Penicillium arizonense]|uniref:Uncharacterized protein n=1 Tax=Penicillium arizonense TaxID=1835702 RepID=A0A1F5L369_PENAI|nr:hypothetical protein PENARI_c043G11853 [Penicillium arizonense]OGE47497.1 hypothetical protein PENARI_c043G11853 [Penicillium arizonense]
MQSRAGLRSEAPDKFFLLTYWIFAVLTSQVTLWTDKLESACENVIPTRSIPMRTPVHHSSRPLSAPEYIDAKERLSRKPLTAHHSELDPALPVLRAKSRLTRHFWPSIQPMQHVLKFCKPGPRANSRTQAPDVVVHDAEQPIADCDNSCGE